MELPVLGIDVSKKKLDVALIINGKQKNKVCTNDSRGFQDLLSWLEKHAKGHVHACMESTGSYGDALAIALADAGHTVSIINPARIKGFAQSELSRTKTDKQDAGLIARFCMAMRPDAWKAPPPEIRELKALVRRLEDLQEMQQMELNRLESGVATQSVERSIRQVLKQIEEEIERTEQLICDHFDQNPGLKRQKDLLTSIPGIGDTTAFNLLAELGVLSNFRNAREIAAYCGLAPRERRSGTSVRGRTRLSKVGNARLRKALYFPAVSALRFNPIIRQFGENLSRRGKPKMAIIGAVMRKLLHMAFGILKHQQPFNPAYA